MIFILAEKVRINLCIAAKRCPFHYVQLRKNEKALNDGVAGICPDCPRGVRWPLGYAAIAVRDQYEEGRSEHRREQKIRLRGKGGYGEAIERLLRMRRNARSYGANATPVDGGGL